MYTDLYARTACLGFEISTEDGRRKNDGTPAVDNHCIYGPWGGPAVKPGTHWQQS